MSKKKQTRTELAYEIRDAIQNQAGGPGDAIGRVRDIVMPICREQEAADAAEAEAEAAAKAAEEEVEETDEERAQREKEEAITAGKNAQAEGADAE